MSEAQFWRGFISVLGVLLVLAFFAQVWNVLIPFLLGLSIAYLVYPLVDPFVAMGFRQDRVVLVLYLMLLGAGILLVIFLLPNLLHQAKIIVQELPSYVKTVDTAIGNINGWLRNTMGHVLGSRMKALEIPFKANSVLDTIIATVPSSIPSVAHVGLWLLIIPFVSFFALTQGRLWVDLLFKLTPAPYVESLLGLLAEINATLGGYIRGLVLESLCIGFLTIASLSALGVEGAIFLGVVTGIINIVPFMAILVGGTLSVLVAIFQGQPSTVIFGIILVFVCVRIIDDFLLVPFVVGHNVKIHPVLILFAILAGFEVGGVLGLLVAVPGAAVLKVIFSALLKSRRERAWIKLHHVHI